jgi:hypothetical protein
MKHLRFCNACQKIEYRKRDRKRQRCESNDPEHNTWMCHECREIKHERQREAAQRAAATRSKSHPGWRRPDDRFWQSRAHSAVSAAIKRGLLPDLKTGLYACTDCGGVAHEYDHRDYGRPLDVQPVCRSCNKRRGTANWPSPSQFDFPKVAASKQAA